MTMLRVPKRLLRSRTAVLVCILVPFVVVHQLLSSSSSTGSAAGVPFWVPGRFMDAMRAGLDIGMMPTDKARISPDRDGDSAGSLDDLVNHPGYLGYDSDKRVEKAKSNKNKRPSMPKHKYLANGLVVPNPKGQHPIFDLLSRSREKWQEKQDKASRTLAEAVDEYRRRYSRPPPKGFDKWWHWAQANDVRLPDEYDQIHTDLEPFWALTPSQIRFLRDAASEREGMYTITCKSKRKIGRRCKFWIQEKGLNEEGKMVAWQRAEAQMEIIRTIEDEVEDVTAVFYSHDVPWQFVGSDYKLSLVEAASLGEYYDSSQEEFDKAHLGWASACAPHKPLREKKVGTLPDLDAMWSADKTYVWDHKAVMDPCTNPDLVHLMGFLSAHGRGPGPSFQMYPVMAMCKTYLHSDVLGVSAEAWTEDVGDDPEWDDKADNRLLWRGKTTGIFFKDGVPWNISQRMNLVEHAARVSGTVPVMQLEPESKAIGAPAKQQWFDLNTRMMDVAFVDDPIQCEESTCERIRNEYKFAERKDWVASNKYKYQLDIDGNGWSARFKRLMSTNSAILKSTIFPEWYMDRIQPWVHYIPVKPDLTDLYDVMTFFQGDNDALAKEIAMAGKAWSKTFWRKEDMVAYQFRLLLELARLSATDRDAASYHARGADTRDFKG